MAVPAAERDEGAVEAIVPRPVLIHVPQAVLISTHRRRAQDDGQQRQSRRDEGHVARWIHHPHAEHNPSKGNSIQAGSVFISVDRAECKNKRANGSVQT